MAASESELTPSAIAALYRQYGLAHKAVGRDEDRLCSKLCEIAKELLLARVKEAVGLAGGRAILCSYSSDGTPLLTQATVVAKLGARKVHRRAGRAIEFLLERFFLKFVGSDGTPVVRCLLRDPRPLSFGKGSWQIFQAACEFLPHLRSLGHEGIIVSHACFDRAVYSAVSRKVQQRQYLWYEHRFGPAPRTGGAALLELTDWHMSTGCVNHDVHNSLKWSMWWLVQEPCGVLRNIHIAVESLRNSFDLLHRYLKGFLSTSLAFVAPESLCDPAEALEFWSLMHLDEDAVAMVQELQLCWDGKQLLLPVRCRNDPDLVEKLAGCLIGAFRFRKFTDSRWVSMGDSCRSLAVSCYLGLQALVGSIRATKEASDYHLHGFAFLDDEALRWCIVCAISSSLADRVLMSLLHDDRLAKRVGEVKAHMRSELSRIASITRSTWARLAGILNDSSPTRLRTEVMLSACIAAAVFTKRSLAVVEQYPWCLCEGNIEENLRALAATAPLDHWDATTIKIRTLVIVGHPMAALIEGVERMADVPWSTNIAEQGHGSTAVIHKFHRGFAADSLCVRGFLHSVRPLFQAASEHVEKREKRLDQRIAAIGNRQPHRITGRHVFLSDLLDSLATTVAPEHREQQGKRVMQKHAKAYSELDAATRQSYDARATSMINMKRGANQESIVVLEEKKKVLRATSPELDIGADGPLRLSKCAFTDRDLEVLVSMFNGPQGGQVRVAGLRVEAMTGPKAPVLAARRVLLDMPHDDLSVARANPGWCKAIATYRGHFSRCAIVVITATERRCFCFLYALQNPLQVGFLPMVETDWVVPVADDASREMGLAIVEQSYQHTFEVDWCLFVFGDELIETEDAEIWVIEGIEVISDLAVASYFSAVPLESYLEDKPIPAPSTAARGMAGGEHDDDLPTDMAQEHPWLSAFGFGASLEEDIEGAGAKLSGAKKVGPEPEPLDDDETDAVFDALEKKRALWALEVPTQPVWFKTTILGGAWTKAHTGLNFDNYKAYASGAVPVGWCQRVFGIRQASFAVKKYGDEWASALAQFWAKRLDYFHQLWIDSGGEEYSCTSAEIASAPTAVDCIQGLNTATVPFVVQQRIDEITGMAPSSSSASSSSSH
jgi:hypothetical protein